MVVCYVFICLLHDDFIINNSYRYKCYIYLIWNIVYVFLLLMTDFPTMIIQFEVTLVVNILLFTDPCWKIVNADFSIWLSTSCN